MIAPNVPAPQPLTTNVAALKAKGLSQLGAYKMLEELSGGIGPRLAGSENAAKAVEWGKQKMTDLGFQNVRLLPCWVPHWVRGDVEKCELLSPSGEATPLTCCALGQSLGTAETGIEGSVIEVHSLQEAKSLGSAIKGKILFFNRPFNSSLVNTFEAYSTAGDQRFAGPALGAALGASAVLVRSMTSDHDDVPHTGVTEFPEKGPRVPAAALSLVAADALSSGLKQHPEGRVRLTLSCKTLPDVRSADVMGEIVGSSKSDEVVVMGGHLDSWDKGRGAHDDGAGVVQGLEALRLMHDLGWKPKRTIRVILWIDEEQRGSGAAAYLARAKRTTSEKTVAGIESDSGGFAPRGFGSSLDANHLHELDPFLDLFHSLEVESFGTGETGADIGPLAAVHAKLFGLEVESQRYFDYHHSDKDTIDKVNARELELGALNMALLAWILAN